LIRTWIIKANVFTLEGFWYNLIAAWHLPYTSFGATYTKTAIGWKVFLPYLNNPKNKDDPKKVDNTEKEDNPKIKVFFNSGAVYILEVVFILEISSFLG